MPNPFAELNLSEESEVEVMAKYLSLPPEVRAIMLDVVRQLGDVVKSGQKDVKQEETASPKKELDDMTVEELEEEYKKTVLKSAPKKVSTALNTTDGMIS